MAVVIPMLGPRQPEPSPHEAFGHARCAMIRAYAAWLRTNPSPSVIAEEIDGTRAAMDQLRQLETAHG